MVSHKVLIQVLLVIDGSRRLSQAPGLLGSIPVLDRANTEAVAQEKLLVEGGFRSEAWLACRSRS